MNKRLVVIGTLLVVLGGLTIFTLTRSGVDKLSITQKVAINKTLAAGASFSLHTLVYPNGQSLSEYNYANGQTETLSPDTGVDGLRFADSMSVSADNATILFRDIVTPVTGPLAAAVQQAGLHITTAESWWLYSTKEKQYRPIPQASIRTAKLDGNLVYVQTFGDNGDKIITYDLATLKQLASIDVVASETFFVLKDGFLLQTNDGGVYFTKDGIVNDQWFTDTTIAGITADKNTAVALGKKNSASNLLRIDLATRSTKLIMNGLYNLPVWRLPGTALFITGSPDSSKIYKMYTYNVAQDKVVLWDLRTGAVKNTSFVPQVLLNTSTAVVSDTSGNYYLLGNNIYSSKK